MMILTALLLSISISAAAPQTKVLLKCNTPVGPNQHITVIRTPTGLVLRELTTRGRTTEHPLSEEDWKSGVLIMTDSEPESVTKLWSTPHGWWIESRSPGINETAPADCY